MSKDPREGGPIWNWFYRVMAGPASVDNAIQGCTEEARAQWKADLERRRQFTRDQRARKSGGRTGVFE